MGPVQRSRFYFHPHQSIYEYEDHFHRHHLICLKDHRPSQIKGNISSHYRPVDNVEMVGSRGGGSGLGATCCLVVNGVTSKGIDGR